MDHLSHAAQTEKLVRMKVSVMIPVYNKAPWLKEAIGSVLTGSYQDFEIVCVDDKSTDNSLDVLRSIDDPRMRIIELAANRGPGGAANAGLDACRGEYIVRMDADDIAMPDRLAVQVAHMDENPDVGASGGYLRLFGQRDTTWPFPVGSDDCRAQQLFGTPVSQPASIMRRRVLDTHGLRYAADWPRFGEDWLFFTRVGRHTRFSSLDRPVTLYRRHPDNISQGRDRFADYTYLLNNVFTFFGVPYSEEDIELHMMSMYLFKRKPTGTSLRALRQWQQRLLVWNAGSSVFPQHALATRLDKAWNGMFHYMPKFGTMPALEHMRISGAWPMDRLVYLAKYRVNRLISRQG